MPTGAVGDRGDKHDGDGERIAIEIIDDNSNDIEGDRGDKHDGDGERIAIEIINDNSNDIEVEKKMRDILRLVHLLESRAEIVLTKMSLIMVKIWTRKRVPRLARKIMKASTLKMLWTMEKKTKAMAKKVPSTIGVGLSTRFVVHRPIITTKAFAIE